MLFGITTYEEFRIDCEDFLRNKRYIIWSKEHPNTIRLRELNRISNATYETFRADIENEDPEISGNTILGLIKVASYLLKNQIQKLEADFVKEGGLRERMTRARIKSRNQDH